jgi:hypothetical protein
VRATSTFSDTCCSNITLTFWTMGKFTLCHTSLIQKFTLYSLYNHLMAFVLSTNSFNYSYSTNIYFILKQSSVKIVLNIPFYMLFKPSSSDTILSELPMEHNTYYTNKCQTLCHERISNHMPLTQETSS